MRFSSDAVDRLYRRHNRALQGLARRHVGREDAEDVVQEAYLRLLELENAGRIADARGYLYRIAGNVALDLLRKRKTRSACLVEDVEFEAVSGGETPFATAVEEAILVRSLQASLAQLPPGCCETFLLSRLYGLTFPEIARRLGISLRTVNRHISRTVDHLQAALDGAADAPDGAKTARVASARARPRAELRL
ncbi:RNA polymerase sigma factor [Methylosinus sp. Sm6]|uniref:RNA polymerase sigma factor n=1 Tax=Methylosinus sp. Sm6 TaxID=2866948 RepID=UPI001C994328|nr:sigma-70 family RNA polymerase sigma factor [Methylosinus sp. Sm6]MBY6242292.1 sigma-70 family RNA polymerase sigma factor [Methylosinus sp. Sm6]